MEVVGWFLIVAGVAYLALKLRLSFATEGGAIGMVPILDGAVVAPTLLWMGLSMALSDAGLPRWVPVIGWIGSVPLLGLLLVRVGRAGERFHRAAARMLNQAQQRDADSGAATNENRPLRDSA